MTEAQVLDGRPLAAQIRDQVRRQARAFRTRYGFQPVLAVVMVGHELASSVYVQQILRSCATVDVPSRVVELPRRTSAEEFRAVLEALNADAEVAGIIVQQPLPRQIPLSVLTDTILPAKDIDGIHPLNTGLMALGYEGFLPACAEAAIEIPKFYGYGLAGLRAVVIGRSNVVGKPVQLLLMREHATVTVCHRQTIDLDSEVRGADLVVTAAGVPGLVTGPMLKPGALVVDVGINVVGNRIVGDVDYEFGGARGGGDNACTGWRRTGHQCGAPRAPRPGCALAADTSSDHCRPWPEAVRGLSGPPLPTSPRSTA